MNKRQKFSKFFQDIVDTVLVIPNCCIESGQYPKDFLQSSFFHSNLPCDVQKELKNFTKEEYQKLNYQEAIIPPFTLNLFDKFSSNLNEWNCSKYDINSAYLSCFLHADFQLPKSNICKHFLVNSDAQNLFSKIVESESSDLVGYVKAFIIPNKPFLPYVPYKTTKKILYTHFVLHVQKMIHQILIVIILSVREDGMLLVFCLTYYI